MNGKWTTSAVVSVCVAVAVGCAAPVEGAADSASTGTTSQASVVVTPIVGRLPGGGTTTPPAPVSTVPVACERFAPVNMVRLVDKEGSPTYGDGFTVPFPTPGALEAAKADPSEWPVYKYEQALAGLGGVNRYEWRVHTVILSSSEIKAEDMHEYFVVGMTDAAATSAKTMLAQDPEWTTKPVDAQILHCVHVWDRTSTGLVQELPGGPVWFVYADEHDPSTHPT